MMGNGRFRTILAAIAAWAMLLPGCSDAPPEVPDGGDAGSGSDVATSETSADSAQDRAEPGDHEASADVDSAVESGRDAPSTDAPSTDAPSTDAPSADRDAPSIDGPSVDADGATCPRPSVWPDGSTSFLLWFHSDRPIPPSEGGSDAGCLFESDAFEFSLLGKTLSQRGCSYFGVPFDYFVNLTEAQIATIVTAITPLHETCAKECGFPHGASGITVSDSNGSQVRFSGNLSIGFPECDAGGGGSSPTPRPPLVDWRELSTFGGVLQEMTQVCASSDAGQDGGPCVVRADGGTTEAGPNDDAQADANDAGPDVIGDGSPGD